MRTLRIVCTCEVPHPPKRAGLLLAGILGVSSPCLAGARDGIYARAGAGLGYSAGTFEYRGPSASGPGSVQPLELQVSPSGPAGGLELALGHAIMPGLALALEMSASIGSASHDGLVGGSHLFLAWRLEGVVIADYYFQPGASWHILAGAGVVGGFFTCDTTDSDSEKNIVECRPLRGFVGVVGGGYAWQSGFGLSARLSLEHLTETHALDSARYTAVHGVVGANYTWF